MGVGGVLSQYDEKGELHPRDYFSRRSPQLNVTMMSMTKNSSPSSAAKRNGMQSYEALKLYHPDGPQESGVLHKSPSAHGTAGTLVLNTLLLQVQARIPTP